MANGITVRVRNYQTYKGRGDVKHNSWFRLSNRLLEDPDFYDFSHAELLVWIQILSLSSQKDSDTIFLNFAHLDRVCRLDQSVVQSALAKLENSQIEIVDDTSTVRTRTAPDTPTVRARDADDTDTCATGQDRQDSTEQDKRARAAPAFEDLLRRLPVVSLDLMRAKVPDEGGLRERLHEAFVYHSADPARAPRSPGQWAKKFQSWVLSEDRRRSQPGKAKADLSGIQFEEEAP